MDAAKGDAAAGDAAAGLWTEHKLRRVLNDELHARPHVAIGPQVQVLHFALLIEQSEEDRAILGQLCAAFGMSPQPERNHYIKQLGPMRLKWERHTEFTTYTFFLDSPGFLDNPDGDPFSDAMLARLPKQWLDRIGPLKLVAVRIAVMQREPLEGNIAEATRLLGAAPLAGSRTSAGGAEIWTDFSIAADNFLRFLVIDTGLRERQGDRLVQRLLEIETYVMMALLALPVARAAGAKMGGFGRIIAQIAQAMSGSREPETDRQLLLGLLQIAAQVEGLVSGNEYRLSATTAYHALVQARIAELREQRIEGLSTIDEFLDRRLSPAVATCRSVAARQDALSVRIARTANLLRTRVEIAIEDQNRVVLQSMDRRAQLQLRLQETVEGLSVVAITYYATSLIEHMSHTLELAHVHLSPQLIAGLATPVVLVIVMIGLRRMRKRLVGGH